MRKGGGDLEKLDEALVALAVLDDLNDLRDVLVGNKLIGTDRNLDGFAEELHGET